MRKLILLLAIIGLTSVVYAQPKSPDKTSEPMKKTVIARLSIKKDAVDKFDKFAQKIVKETRNEEGCLSYRLYKDCSDQGTEFIFYEEYKDQPALDHHNKSEYLKQFLADVTPLLEGKPIIEVF